MATVIDITPRLANRRRRESGRLHAESLGAGRVAVEVSRPGQLFGVPSFVLSTAEVRRWIATLSAALESDE